jgi:hypothetical protein
VNPDHNLTVRLSGRSPLVSVVQPPAANDLDVFGDLYQCGYRCLQVDAGAELHNRFNHHSSRHCSCPFRAVPRSCCVQSQDGTDGASVMGRRRQAS